MIPLIYIVLIILSALTDSLFFVGEKELSKLVEAIFVVGLFSVPLLYKKNFKAVDLLTYGLIYFFLHIALFDFSFNLFSGLKMMYIGRTDYFSLIIQDISHWQNVLLRVWFLFLALLIYYKRIYK
jgi:hypothetical protein